MTLCITSIKQNDKQNYTQHNNTLHNDTQHFHTQQATLYIITLSKQKYEYTILCMTRFLATLMINVTFKPI